MESRPCLSPTGPAGGVTSHILIHIPWCPGNGSVILLPMGRDRADLGDEAVIPNALAPSAFWLGVGVGADLYREGAICYNNWCWAAFTQQPACLGRQYLKNMVLKFGLARDMGDFEGSSASGVHPITDLPAILASFLTPELVLFHGGSPSACLT